MMVHQKTYNPAHTLAQQTGAIKRSLLIAILVSIGVILFTVSMLPQSYDADTSQIGNGKPAIVIIYDGENAVSDELMESFSRVRGDLEAQVAFILADINAPKGRAFARANATPTAAALFFDGKGNRITALYSPQDADTLKRSIMQIFGL
jgi:hypothetical protein